MNQGIIKHAQNATEAYNDAQNNETEYLTYAEGEMDKYAGVSGGAKAPEEDLDLLRRYFLGVNQDGSIGSGQNINLVANITEDGKPENYKNNNIISDASNSIESLNIYSASEDTRYVYVKYDNRAYKVTADFSYEIDYEAMTATVTYNTKSVDLVYIPHGAEGETRTYNGEQWTVLYDKGDKLELVSPDSFSDGVSFGWTDPDISGPSGTDKSIASYNNAVNKLNQYCRTTLNDTTARSVGSNPNNPDADTTATYSSTNTDNWNTAYNGRGLAADDNWEQDYVRMCYWGIEQTERGYALASRSITQGADRTVFGVRGVSGKNYGGYGSQGVLWGVTAEEAVNYGSQGSGVRACVTVSK